MLLFQRSCQAYSALSSDTKIPFAQLGRIIYRHGIVLSNVISTAKIAAGGTIEPPGGLSGGQSPPTALFVASIVPEVLVTVVKVEAFVRNSRESESKVEGLIAKCDFLLGIKLSLLMKFLEA